jgi:hypothetical protein
MAAEAQSSGDMFADRTGVVPNGPAYLPHTDMFGQPVYTLSTNTDMYGRPPNVLGPDVDVFGKPKPDAYNMDMFHSTVNDIPDQPLYHWPYGAPYP